MPFPEKLRVAVIGCGVIGPLHISCFAANENSTVVAVCDIDESRAKAAAEKAGIARWTTNASEIFADPNIDAVSICTDHATHAKLAVAALVAGKHVICEKCLGRTKTDVNLMVAAAAAHPHLITSGVFQHRFEPLPRAVKYAIDDGMIGRLVCASGELFCIRTPEYYKADAWRGTIAGEGGSVLINQAIHYFDLLLWITGGGVAVRGFKANLERQGVIETEDTVAVSLRLANGALATFTACSSTNATWDNRLLFVGTKGTIELRDDHIYAVSVQDRAEERRLRARLVSAERRGDTVTQGKSYYGFGHQAQIDNFVAACTGGTKPRVTFADAAATASLAFDFYSSCE